MPIMYNYYYIGESPSADGGEGVRSPILLTFSKMKNGKKGETGVHSHPYMEVFWFESGFGYFECGGKTVPVYAGDTLIVSAGKKHVQYSGDDSPFTYYCFAVTSVSRDGAGKPDSFSDEGYAIVRADKGKSFYPLIAACKDELDGRKTGCYAAASAYFKLLLIEILRALGNSEVKAEQPTAAGEIKSFIETHYNEDLTLDMLCKKFYVNKSNLLHSFKAEFGISPLKYLNAYRIEKAKKLLVGGESVTGTAMEVGITNPVYFAELFHRYTGLSPSAFKKISQTHR